MNVLKNPGARSLAVLCAGFLVLAGCQKKSTSTTPPPGTKGGRMPGVPQPKVALTSDAAGTAITTYVTTTTTGSADNTYTITDDTTMQPVMLTWTRNVPDGPFKTGEGTYVSSAEFTSPDGQVYVVDYWITSDDDGNGTVTQGRIRSANGVARYTWTDQGGLFVEQPVVTTPAG